MAKAGADGAGGKKGFWATYWDQLRWGIIIAVSLAVLAAGWWAAVEYFTDRPATWRLAAAPDGRPVPIRSVLDDRAAPALAEFCSKPRVIRWVANRMFDRRCTRLVFDPPGLADMLTERMPFEETAPTFRLLELFVERHTGCLTMTIQSRYRDDEDRVVIAEASPSSLTRRADGTPVCPRFGHS